MQSASTHVFPVLELSNKQRKRMRKPWMSCGILKSMDRRDSLFDEWLKTKIQVLKGLTINAEIRLIELSKLHKNRGIQDYWRIQNLI